eukprot:2684204-Lingulodinium_polyedra.AAC.1
MLGMRLTHRPRLHARRTQDAPRRATNCAGACHNAAQRTTRRAPQRALRESRRRQRAHGAHAARQAVCVCQSPCACTPASLPLCA